MKVPEVAQQPDVLPIADAWQKCIHQDDFADFFGILGGVRVSHHQADIVADQLRELKQSGPDALPAYVRNVRLKLFSEARRAILEVPNA
jgi:hypothetical protein